MSLFGRPPTATVPSQVVAIAAPLIMYDSTNPGAIPSNAALVASYVDGYGGYDAAVKRFGPNKVVSISVNNNDAQVADVEPGAMTPAMLPNWVARQRARGIPRPVVYSDGYEFGQCFAYVGNSVSYWTADPVGYPITLPGRDAVQYLWTSGWDASWVLPSFPFYPGPPTPPDPYPVLRQGASGPDVAKLQTLLNRHGARPALTVDGAFGPLTLAAVEAYQRAEKLTPLGTVTKAMWLLLLGKPQPTPTQEPVLRVSDTGVAVTVLQNLLNAHGVQPRLTVDGNFGPLTLAAVKEFQTSVAVTVDGIVGPVTWGKLGDYA